jgi:hypothetical protein
VAVSPGGGAVFVTGGATRTGAASGDDDITVAYNAATGARRWVSRYNGPAGLKDDAHSLAVAPGSREVVVTVASHGRGSGIDYATVAYNAATGARLWVSRYNSRANSTDDAASVAIGPGGHRVSVTGHSRGVRSWQDYATIAYNAATGAGGGSAATTARTTSPTGPPQPPSAPAGSIVYVTGFSEGRISDLDYAAVAYNAATGEQAWARRYNGTTNADDAGEFVAAGSGGTAFVTGTSEAGQTNDYVTIAYHN